MPIIEECGDDVPSTVPKQKLNDEERKELADKLDRELDDFINVLAENSKSNPSNQRKEPFNFDKFCEELDQHPAFMRDLKPQTGGEYSEAIQALQAMKYDDSVEDIDAEHAKEEGNKFFKHKKYRWARDAYTNGIKAKSPSTSLNSALYGNRAAAQRHLGNLSSAVRDCLFAIKFNVENLKAALRGAECLLELGYAHRCVDWYQWFMKEFKSKEGNTETEEYKKFTKEIEVVLGKATSRLKAEERDERRRKAEQKKIDQEKRALLAAFCDRQLKFTPPIDFANVEDFELGDVCIRSPYTKEKLQERVYVDYKNGEILVWPLLLVYVGQSQTDMIKDCGETSTLGDLLTPVFEHPAPWDQAFEYKLENLRFFLPLDVFDDRQVEELSLNQSLREILSIKDHYIVQGLPIIHVYTKQKASQELDKLEHPKRFRLH